MLKQHVHTESLPWPAFYTRGSIAEISPPLLPYGSAWPAHIHIRISQECLKVKAGDTLT